MVYTAALVFGHVMPVVSEEEGVVEMMRRFLVQLTSGEKSGGGRRGSVESCDDMEKSWKNDDLDNSCDFDEDKLLQSDMTRQIERCLSEAKGSTLGCQVLLLPRQMSARVARDVVRSSADEPCGLRGASIEVYLEAKAALIPLGSISPDASVTPTFKLSVVFKADDDGWPPLKHILGTDKMMKLRPEYRLIKKKLYSSASPVIHDFY